MRKLIGVLLICAAVIIPFLAFDVLPVIGDTESAPNSHVSDYYIEKTIEVANSPNMVTSVIVDFRAADTMLETTVMFLAGVCVLVILSRNFKSKKRIIEPALKLRSKNRNTELVFKSINSNVMISVIQPMIFVYAVYVLFHGEVSLGGGFQAGALIGTVFLLDEMVIPENRNFPRISASTAAIIAGIGTFIYAFTGILTMLGGGIFLEYAKLPFPVEIAEKHSIGILLVEIGVTLGVAGTIISITNTLMDRERFDDSEIGKQ